jgi:hypothetical protein
MYPPLQNLKLVIVIPCLAETGISQTLESLRKNSGFTLPTECLVVINHSALADQEIKSINQKILDDISAAREKLNSDNLKFIPVATFNLPDKKAGVGLARKIGMDMAVERLKQSGNLKDGIIVCLDGDCTVQENYLAEIEKFFSTHKANGCSIYFEHPLDGENAEGIIDYELFLRYYNGALRWTGFPYAFQTVGSSMAVSAIAYEKQGGMNTRKAGEDFYFLNKIVQLERFGDLTTTTVFPSSRKSERVPFGTGREMIEWEKNRHLPAYHPDLFIELKKIFGLIDEFLSDDDPLKILSKKNIHPLLIDYLQKQKLNEGVLEAKTHTATPAAFRKRFFVWMNAFRIMKLLNELSLSSFSKLPIHQCASWLWQNISSERPGSDAKNLLLQFRKYDRLNARRLE